jgi:hypothetical protein
MQILNYQQENYTKSTCTAGTSQQCATWMRPLRLRGLEEGACGHSSQPPLSHRGCLTINILELRKERKATRVNSKKISLTGLNPVATENFEKW